MLTLLRKGYSKIMQLFYDNKIKELHLREIARQTNLFGPSVSRFLNMLEKEDVLKSKKEGNLKKYSIKKNTKTYFIFSIFDFEKFEKLTNIRKNAIKIYLKKLDKKPIFVILFGSTAKENFKKESDIDILIVTNSKIDTKKAEKEVDALTTMKINSFQITYDFFLKELKLKDDKVIQSAINSGYPLINHISYYEVIYDE